MVRNYLEVVATLFEIIPIPSFVVALIAARRAVQFVQELDLHNSVLGGDSRGLHFYHLGPMFLPSCLWSSDKRHFVFS